MKKEFPILITGCSRSGSSMIAAAINACGAFGGNMTENNQSSKRGMFENVKIREAVVKSYLSEIGADIAGQYPLVDTKNLIIPMNTWKADVEYILSKEGYTGGKWMYKDSRSALLWPVWDYAYPDAKWLIVRRRTGDVINSCVKTGFMKAFKNIDNQKAVGAKSEMEAWLWWIHQYEDRFNEMINAGLNCRVIWPQRMENGDYGQLYETIDWLGLKWSEKAMDYIKPLLWGSKQKERK